MSKKRYLASGLLAVMLTMPMARSTHADSCAELVRKAQGEEDPVRAERILEAAVTTCKRLEDENVKLEDENLRLIEEALSLRAENHLRVAKADTSACDRYNDANFSVEGWVDYIDWYVDDLGEEERSLFRPKKTIFKAMTSVGEAVAYRGDGQPCNEAKGREQLFQIYRTYEPEYFNEAALDLWQRELWLCPDWPDKRQAGKKRLEERICSDEFHCQDEWRLYLSFLELWTEGERQKLLGRAASSLGRENVKTTRNRLREIFERCPG